MKGCDPSGASRSPSQFRQGLLVDLLLLGPPHGCENVDDVLEIVPEPAGEIEPPIYLGSPLVIEESLFEVTAVFVVLRNGMEVR